MATLRAVEATQLLDLPLPHPSFFNVLDFVTADAISFVFDPLTFVAFGPFAQATTDDAVTEIVWVTEDDADVVTLTGLRALQEGDLVDLFTGSATQVLSALLSGRDKVVGSRDADALSGFGGRDKVFGNGGDDDVAGGAGNDRVYGGAGDDTVRGEGGRDLVSGGKGDDTLLGGAGGDRFVFEAGDGSDLVRDFQDGRDRLQILGATGTADLTIAADGGNTVITFDGLTVTLRGVDRADIDGSDFLF